MNELKVTLKQVTPIIHFQADQEGATLRASEVKPKLDKFLIQQMYENVKNRGEDISKEEWLNSFRKKEPGLFISTDTPALNYKMIFRTVGENLSMEHPGFEKENKFFVGDSSFYESVALTIISQENLMIKFLKAVLLDFFAIHNFGSRQRHGFGSFIVDTMDGKTQSICDNKKAIEKASSFYLEIEFPKITSDNKVDTTGIRDVISDFWGKCKAGINHNGYTPSYLMKDYFYNRFPENINEKKAMKSIVPKDFTLIGDHNTGKVYDEKEKMLNKIIYIRGLLGFADNYILKVKLEEYEKIKIDLRYKLKFEIRDDGDGDRFPSPVLFKPFIGNANRVNIYLIIDDKLLERFKDITEVELIPQKVSVKGGDIKPYKSFKKLTEEEKLEFDGEKDEVERKSNKIIKGMIKKTPFLKLTVPENADKLIKEFFEWVIEEHGSGTCDKITYKFKEIGSQ
ncbi:hypothetical protein [Lactovum odontotermitis]